MITLTNERPRAANLPYVILSSSSVAGHPGVALNRDLYGYRTCIWLDYCNSLLAGVSNELGNKLQSVLRSAARLVLRKRKFYPITDDLRDQLHWLSIRQRNQYKLGVLVHKCLRGDAPPYLTDMISPVGNGSQRLRSAAHGDLAVPRTRTVRMGPRSFAVSGPTLWNSLPVELKTAHIPLETFKSKLKTYLFTIAYHQ